MEEKKETNVLFIDSEGVTHRKLSVDQGSRTLRMNVVSSLSEAEAALEESTVEVVVFVCQPETREPVPSEAVREIRNRSLFTEVIVLSEALDDGMTIAALRAGAYDVITLPVTGELLWGKISRAAAAAQMKREYFHMRQDVAVSFGLDGLVGNSKAITALRENVQRLAPTDISVLITGEAGVGKSFLARILHYHSHRRYHPFVCIDGVHADEKILETLLFGTEDQRGNGLPPAVLRADGGTLFLDNVESLPMPVQDKLMTFLKDFTLPTSEGESRRKVEFRLLSATRTNLEHAVDQGTFREDLFYRLNVVTVTVPTLAERKEDIALLSDALVRKLSRTMERKPPMLAPEAVEKLRACRWKENVRDLEALLKEALVRCSGEVLTVEDLPRSSDETTWCSSDSSEYPANSENLLEDSQRAVIRRALIDNNWNFTQTAQALGIGRTTLWRKLKKYDIKKEVETT